MGPCHAEKTTRQSDDDKKSFHSKNIPLCVMASPSSIAGSSKPKILFNLLVNNEEDVESNEEFQAGHLKPPNALVREDSFRNTTGTDKDPNSFGSLNRREGRDLEHMAKVEMTRNKLKILLTEPLDRSSDCLSSRSFSEPITPPLRNMVEFGKRTNSEGSQYRSLILKKRQKELMLSPTSNENLLLSENQLQNKRMKNGSSQSSFDLPNNYESAPMGQETPLLKKLLSAATDDEDSEPENGHVPVKRLAEVRRSLSNSDIYSTSTLTYSPSIPSPLSWSQPFIRSNSIAKLSLKSNDSLFDYLCNSVQYALRLPGFRLLSVDDKRSMIIKAAPRLILLYMAKDDYQLELSLPEELEEDGRSSESSRPTMDFVESLRLFIKRFQQYRITEKEFSYLKNIVIYQYSDPQNSLKGSECTRNNLLESLEGLRDLSSEDKTRHGQLLLQLHSLFQLDLKTMETLFFQPLLHSVESLKKLKHLYSENAWFLENPDKSETVS